MAPADTDPRNPHDLAVDVQTDLQKLATALAHAGANPKAVAQLTQMAQVIGSVVKALANGPVPGPQDQSAPPEQAAPGPPQGGPPAPGPAQGPPPPGPAHQAAHHSMQSASQALHAAMIASAAARQQQGR